jgi:hypothetical protein
MSAASAERTPDDLFLNTFVRQCRRRLVVTVLVRRLCLTSAVVAGVIAATRLAIGDIPLTLVLTAGSVVALLTATMAALVRQPSLASTALFIDRRLGTPETITAGVECLAGSSAIDTLVVRAAGSRLRGISVTRLVPVTLRRTDRTAALVATAFLLFLIAGVARSESPRTTSSDERRMVIPGGSGAQSGRAEGGQTTSTPAVSTERTETSHDVATSGVHPPSASSNETSSSPEGSQGAQRHLADNETRATSPGTQEGSASDGRAGEGSRGSDSARNASPPEGGGATAAGRSHSPASGAGGRSVSTSATSNAGGIARGSLTGEPVRTSDHSSTEGSPRERYAAARRDAEAALSHESIAPEYRAIVRQYFSSIETPAR